MHSNAEDLRTFEDLESSCRNARIPPRPLLHQRPFKNASRPAVSPELAEGPNRVSPSPRFDNIFKMRYVPQWHSRIWGMDTIVRHRTSKWDQVGSLSLLELTWEVVGSSPQL